MLPTPSAADGLGGHLSRGGARSNELLLAGVAKTLLPTPRATRGGSATETVALLPTPVASDSKGSARTTTATGAGNYPTLLDAIRLLPTPSAADSERGPDYARMGRQESGGDDLVTTLARLSGDRMRPSSDAGSESLDDALLTLWTGEAG